MNLSKVMASFSTMSDPYGTHINLLRSAGSDGLYRVLELGAGRYSTPVFLDRNFYPDLAILHTVEQNMDWVPQIEDPRHSVSIVPEPIEPFLDTLTLDDYDLIFVDNSSIAENREATLRYIAEHTGRSLVIAHDWERESYRQAGSGFKHSFVDDRQSPWTAILWGNK